MTGRQTQQTRRPHGLIIVILVGILLGVLSLVGGIASLSLHGLAQPQGLGFLQGLAPILPDVMIILGIFFLVLSAGLWMGYVWAWMLMIAFEVIHIIADVGFIASRSFAVDKFIGLCIIVGTLYYLTRPHVRAFFQKNRSFSRHALS